MLSTPPVASAQDVMRRYVEAVTRHDFDAAFTLLAPDVVTHVPGRSALRGTRHGRQAFLDYIAAVLSVAELEEGGVVPVDALAGDERFVLLVTERLRQHGRRYEIRRANVYRVAAGQIREITIYEGDQYVVDELLADAGVAGAERAER